MPRLSDMTAGAGGVDLSTAEIVEWEIQGKEAKTRIQVEQGSILEVRTVIAGVFRVGNDPSTGHPRYSVNAQNIVLLVGSDKRLRKSILKQPGAGEGSASTGVG